MGEGRHPGPHGTVGGLHLGSQSSVGLVGVESLNSGPCNAGWGCWTSPGKHNIRECLRRGEEGKDDPVHHPFHLKVQRAALDQASREHVGPHLCLPTMLEVLWGRDTQDLNFACGSHQGWGKGTQRNFLEVRSH